MNAATRAITLHDMSWTVLLYEDNQQLRESVTRLLEYTQDFTLLGAYANVLDVEREVANLKPDIILMDINMPGGFNGIEAVRKIRKLGLQVHIIMLTVFDDNKNVLDAIYAGADGYLLKKHLSSRLETSLHEVLDGGAPMSASIARMVIASMHQTASLRETANARQYQLTSREKDILYALSQGTSYKSIAADYFISIDTVRSHIKNIYQKLQVHSQLEAVAKARSEGLL